MVLLYLEIGLLDSMIRLRNLTVKVRAYPDKCQVQKCHLYFDSLRSLWNCANEQRIFRMKNCRGSGNRWPTHREQNKELTELRSEYDWLQYVPTEYQQHLLGNLSSAWISKFEGINDTPNFKDITSNVRSLTSSIRSTGRKNQLHHITHTYIHMPGLGKIYIKGFRFIDGCPVQITLKLQPTGKWFIYIVYEVTEEVPSHSSLSKTVGIDIGVRKAVSDSNGGFVENPNYTKLEKQRMDRLQHELDRRVKGSENYKKTSTKIALLHESIVNRKEEWTHKVANDYTDHYGTLICEKLQLQNLVKSAKGTVESPGVNVKAKSCLNRELSNLAPGRLIKRIEEKMIRKGGTVIKVAAHYTSQDCNVCKYRDKGNRKRDKFKCLSCGHTADADTNAACNILEKGLQVDQIADAVSVTVCGGLANVQPKKQKGKTAKSTNKTVVSNNNSTDEGKVVVNNNLYIEDSI